MADEKPKKPKGFKAFDELTRKLIQVPKEEVEQQIERSREQRAERRKDK
jgi:hypothetical protein